MRFNLSLFIGGDEIWFNVVSQKRCLKKLSMEKRRYTIRNAPKNNRGPERGGNEFLRREMKISGGAPECVA
jgi:hypothetical protein